MQRRYFFVNFYAIVLCVVHAYMSLSSKTDSHEYHFSSQLVSSCTLDATMIDDSSISSFGSDDSVRVPAIGLRPLSDYSSGPRLDDPDYWFGVGVRNEMEKMRLRRLNEAQSTCRNVLAEMSAFLAADALTSPSSVTSLDPEPHTTPYPEQPVTTFPKPNLFRGRTQFQGYMDRLAGIDEDTQCATHAELLNRGLVPPPRACAPCWYARPSHVQWNVCPEQELLLYACMHIVTFGCVFGG